MTNGPIEAMLGRRRIRRPALGKRPRRHRCLELVLRHDRHEIEDPDARPERHGRGNDDGPGVGRGHGQRLPADGQRRDQRTPRPRVVQRLEREDDVGRRERRAVRPGNPVAQRQRMAPSVRRRRPLLRQPGLDFLRRPVDPDQTSLGQLRKNLGADLSRDQAVECSGVAPRRGDERSAASWRKCGRRVRSWSPASCRSRASRGNTGRRPRPQSARSPGCAVVGSLFGQSANRLAVLNRGAVRRFGWTVCRNCAMKCAVSAIVAGMGPSVGQCVGYPGFLPRFLCELILDQQVLYLQPVSSQLPSSPQLAPALP